MINSGIGKTVNYLRGDSLLRNLLLLPALLLAAVNPHSAPAQMAALPDAPTPVLLSTPSNFATTAFTASQASPAPAQEASATQAQPADQVITMFPHTQTGPYWVSGQINVIFQANPGF